MGNIYGRKKSVQEPEEKISLEDEIAVLEKKKKSVEALIRTYTKKVIECKQNKQEALRFLIVKKRYEKEATTLYAMLTKLEELKNAKETIVIQNKVVSATSQATKSMSRMVMDSLEVREIMDESQEMIDRVNDVTSVLSQKDDDPDIEAELEAMILAEKPDLPIPAFPAAPTNVPKFADNFPEFVESAQPVPAFN